MQKDNCCFIGIVNFYRGLYSKRAKTLAPLMDLCGQKKKIKWEDTQEKAFQAMKNIIAQGTVLTYP
jgi:hypothetical protein